jgi:hypothetical protein
MTIQTPARAVFDELPGVVQKRCRECGEWWPDDAEFYQMDRGHGRRYLHGVCLACEGLGVGLELYGPKSTARDRSCEWCRLPLGPSHRIDARYCSRRCRRLGCRRPDPDRWGAHWRTRFSVAVGLAS